MLPPRTSQAPPTSSVHVCLGPPRHLMMLRLISALGCLAYVTAQSSCPATQASTAGKTVPPDAWSQGVVLLSINRGDVAMKAKMPPMPMSAMEVNGATSDKVATADSTKEQTGQDQKEKGPKDADWFGGFYEAESTYDRDGHGYNNDYQSTLYDPSIDKPQWVPSSWTKDGFEPEWFAETRSGGPLSAWQTYYPALQDASKATQTAETPQWLSRAAAVSTKWSQQYSPDEPSPLYQTLHARRKRAGWFDTAVNQFDIYGRERLPSPWADQYYVEWEQRTTSGKLACPDRGCTAQTMIQAYDGATEEAALCKLTVGVHATDFDDEYSREYVEFISANGALANTRCDPMASECRDIALIERPLYPCVTDFVIDRIIGVDGTVNVSGKISEMVDECPVDGNLFSAIANVTCFVRPRRSMNLTAPEQVASNLLSANQTALLTCQERGCSAKTHVVMNYEAIQNASSCLLNVRLYQTDYDNDHGSVETIEWIQVDGAVVATDLVPGRNPCKEKFMGLEVPGEPWVDIVTDQDVTPTVRDLGYVEVQAKISDMVDECGKEGFLLYGEANVACT
mmetsp:Transcript_17585/g.31745  ORF Transcript_17585/g.31745 Transcript_17585/m.31745 type:complete len:567 (+) Transcript_17585:30-1730(+)